MWNNINLFGSRGGWSRRDGWSLYLVDPCKLRSLSHSYACQLPRKVKRWHYPRDTDFTARNPFSLSLLLISLAYFSSVIRFPLAQVSTRELSFFCVYVILILLLLNSRASAAYKYKSNIPSTYYKESRIILLIARILLNIFSIIISFISLNIYLIIPEQLRNLYFVVTVRNNIPLSLDLMTCKIGSSCLCIHW